MSDNDRAPGFSINRRRFFQVSAAAGVAASLPQIITAPPASAAQQITGVGYAGKFTQPLRTPPRIDLTPPGSTGVFNIVQFKQQVLEGYPATTLYGYGPVSGKPSWPGPTIVAESGNTVYATFRNQLPTGSKTLAEGGHLLPVDPSLLDEKQLALKAGDKPIVTHLHGSHVEWESDGYPDAWYTQRGAHGDFWKKAIHVYDNSQVGGTLWYHDHTHAVTRLNVFAGMAGLYLLRDETEGELVSTKVLPNDRYETELIFQDRFFSDDGQLFMPTSATVEDGILASVFADFIMVNGRPWPYMEVEPRKYRFRMLNGSDGRIYVLQLSNNAPMLVVGTELSMLTEAVPVTRLPIAPGERYDVVIDFSNLPMGTELTLTNQGTDGILRGFGSVANPTNRPSDPAFGFGGPANPASTGQVMKFKVTKSLSAKPDATVVAGTALGPALPPLNPTKTRGVITFNGRDGLNRGMEMQGTIEGGTMMWHDAPTEIIENGTTEIWEIYNTGPVAHPIHLHLVDFELLDRTPFTWTATPMPMHDGVQGAMIEVISTGTSRGPEAYEVGRKDTVICYPNEVTRIAAKFDRKGNYVWHCHILHHEDHDMMRPVIVR